MRPPRGQAAIQAAGQRPALELLLSRYPRLSTPELVNVSQRHMAAMAKRASSGAGQRDLLSRYLATV